MLPGARLSGCRPGRGESVVFENEEAVCDIRDAGSLTSLDDDLGLVTPQARAPKAVLIQGCRQSDVHELAMLRFNWGSSCDMWSWKCGKKFRNMTWSATRQICKENYQERCMTLCGDRRGVDVVRWTRRGSGRVCFDGWERGKQGRSSSSTFNAGNDTKRGWKDEQGSEIGIDVQVGG